MIRFLRLLAPRSALLILRLFRRAPYRQTLDPMRSFLGLGE